MESRIAGPLKLHTHTNEIHYINQLMINLKLWLAGLEPLTITLEYLGEWQKHRASLLACHTIDSKFNYVSRHQAYVAIYDDLIPEIKRVITGEASEISNIAARLEQIDKAFWDLHRCAYPAICY